MFVEIGARRAVVGLPGAHSAPMSATETVRCEQSGSAFHDPGRRGVWSTGGGVSMTEEAAKSNIATQELLDCGLDIQTLYPSDAEIPTPFQPIVFYHSAASKRACRRREARMPCTAKRARMLRTAK